MQISSLNTALSFLAPNAKSAEARPVDNSSSQNQAYILDLSDSALQMMNSSAKDSSSADSINGIADDLGTTRLADDLKSLEKELSRVLLSRNIDPQANYEFSINANGRIEIKGEGANKAEIERIINENSDLSNHIRQTITKADTAASAEIQKKYAISIDDDDNKDDEEKKRILHEKAMAAQERISSLSGNFSMSCGQISVASLDFAAGFSFSL